MNFTQPILLQNLETMDPLDFLSAVTRHCNHGKPMHQETLKNIVLKLTLVSRDMELTQHDRDEAAQLATELGNAGLKAYGSKSEFGATLLQGIQSIMNGTFAKAS